MGIFWPASPASPTPKREIIKPRICVANQFLRNLDDR
jgi:hypothetical protein